MNKKRALITGITGQDGSYLAELLLNKGYEVHGTIRRHSVETGRLERIEHIKDKVHFHTTDLLDESGIFSIVQEVQPNELYSLAAQSHVGHSSKMPIFTTRVDAVGVITLLEALRQFKPDCKFYQASSSEIFGSSVDDDGYQRETTYTSPVSPYACAKLFSYHITRHYRTAYDMFACNGILFNHESARRGENFVTQKIVSGALDIINGDATELLLGNLDSYRDWSHAEDMVYGMWLIMQHDMPDDFVLSSGTTHSVREFCDIVFSKLGLDYKKYVRQDPRFMRPQELSYLKGDCSKAKNTLNWKPKYSFNELVEDMIKNNVKYNETNVIKNKCK